MALPPQIPPIKLQLPQVVTTADGDLGGTLSFATWAIVEATGDLEFPLRVVRGVEAIRQFLLGRFQFFKREWFLDLRQGLPYYEAILIKNPDLTLVESIFRRATLGTPGVLRIARMVLSLDNPTRALTIHPFEIVLTGNVVFRAQPEEFIIPISGLANTRQGS